MTRPASLGAGRVTSDVTKPIVHFGSSNKLSNAKSEQNVSDSSPASAVADKPQADAVRNPLHYRAGGIEVWEFLDAYFPDDPHRWNAGKYIARAGKKDPSKLVEDLEKAIQFLQRRIEIEKARTA